MSSPPSSVASIERGTLSEPALRLCRAVLALMALTAIGYDVAAGPGVSDGDYFSYFTVLSNLFATGMLLHGALRPAHTRSRTVELLRGAAVVYILTTGIVYLLLLSGRAPAYPWVNAILHYLMPVAVTLDWLLDPPRVHLDLARTVVLWMAFPLLYVLYTLTRGAIVGWYPYFFVNPHRDGGYLLVAGDCLAVGIGIVALITAATWAGNRRHDTLARRMLLLAGWFAVVAVLSGCGSSKPRPDPATEARLVAETNALCTSMLHRAHPSHTHQREAQHHLATLTKALSDAAEYLPAGRSLNEAHVKRQALYAEISKLAKSGTFGTAVSRGPDYIERFYRLQVQIYDDYKALGLKRCLGRPPRPPISG